MTETVYTVTGMTCEHCERAVSEEVGLIAGVTATEVDAKTGVLRVTSKTAIDDQSVFDAVDEAGYEAARA